MNDNQLLAIFNKKYMLNVYSGTLAIEGILKSLNLRENSKVLISSYVCYSILQAIINANLVPVIAIPKNGVTLSKEELDEILNKEKIAVFIAVHQYGYEQVIVKKTDLIIIEDISQSWNIKLNNRLIGENTDYIICSLGITKPLSNKIGGVILSNYNFIKYFDTKSKECRYLEYPLLNYYYPLNINYKKIINLANKKIRKQRKIAGFLNNIFRNYKFITLIDIQESLPSYHRYVIEMSVADSLKLMPILDKCQINYQKEYKIKLYETPLARKYEVPVIGEENQNIKLLIKTDNKIKKLKKLKKEMGNLYEKNS